MSTTEFLRTLDDYAIYNDADAHARLAAENRGEPWAVDIPLQERDFRQYTNIIPGAGCYAEPDLRDEVTDTYSAQMRLFETTLRKTASGYRLDLKPSMRIS